ncbi:MULTISPECIES: hypothetical protein [unclassified Mycobacteroides]|uniref:hypothetical protein n=1 Tax=unclassified Mycobacteroides TaxID=2618759 RepID=UPI001323AED3|nr:MULTISPECIES: hypothetical protein [unclassified Mycobacteroides]MUM18062.1 hypothetical protein [Mycobacteroides sp. CBMA 326]
MVTVLSSGTLMGGFGVFAITTPAADAKPGGGSDNDHDHNGLGGVIHKITGGLLGGGVGGGGGPGSGGTRNAPSSPSFGKSLHSGSGSEGAAGGHSSDSKGSGGDKGDKDKGPGANVPKPGSVGSSVKSSDDAPGTVGPSTHTPTGTGIGANLPNSGGPAGVHTGPTTNSTATSTEKPSGTTAETGEHTGPPGALGVLPPKTVTATTPKTETATSPHTPTASGATADAPAAGSTHTEHETTSSEEPKVPGVTIKMGGRTIVIWKKPSAGGGTTHTPNGGTTHDHESGVDHEHVINLPGLPGIGGTPNVDAPSGGAAGTRTPGGNPGIHTGPVSPPSATLPKAPAVAIATPPAPPVIAAPPPVVPPAPPVTTVRQAEGGRGGDVVVTAGGARQPDAVAKPIQQYVAAETIAPRTGYTDYLRLTKTSEIAAVAIPGAAGIAMMTFIGAALGYRQAKAGHTVRASAAARFLE